MPVDGQALSRIERNMKRLGMVLRIGLGGAVRVSFVGIFIGALVGILYGIAVENVSLGLNGAMIGGCLAGLGGAVFGIVVAISDAKEISHPLGDDGADCSGPNIITR